MEPEPDDRLVALAAVLADGGTPDWDAAESAADGVISRLRTIGEIARLHQTLTGSDSPVASTSPLLPPATWNGLRLIQTIGEGRFGTVYRAFDPSLDREVAVKLLHARDDDDVVEGERVIEEGRLAARVRHPYVVTIHGARRVDGRTGIWMELVRGRSLEAELSARGPLPVAEIRRIAIELGRALEAVHDAGLVHRDVKTRNVMREADGRVVLGDFGTGRELEDSERRRSGLAGTPPYLAPEIFQGQPATERSDIYSLGALLYRLATGAYPVRAESLADLRRAHTAGVRPSVRGRRSDLPSGLAAVIDRALDPDPARRFPTAAAMEAAVAPGPSRVQRVAVAAAAAVAAVGAIGAAVWWGSGANAPAPAGVSALHIDTQLQTRAALRGPGHGRLIPCAPRGTLAVAVCDLNTGAATILRPRVGTPRFLVEYAPALPTLLSPDGKLLAYPWIRNEGDVEHWSIGVIDVATARDQVIYTPEPGRTVMVEKWLAGGSALLFSESVKGQPVRFKRVHLAGGAPEHVWELELGQSAIQFDLSFDGRSALVERLVAPNNRDVVAIDVTTGVVRWELNGPADDRAGMWAPDDRGIVFVSDRLGGESVMYAQIGANGQPGAPALLRDMGRSRARLAGFGGDGSLFVIITPNDRTAFLVDLSDPAVGDRHPMLEPRAVEDTVGAGWGPDGRIAYLRGRVLGDGTSSMLVVRGGDGTVEREVKLPGVLMPWGTHARWSPDGRRIAASYFDGKTIALDVIDFSAAPVARRRVAENLRHPRWGRSNDAVYFLQDRAVRRVNLKNLTSSVVYRPPETDRVSGNVLDVSRDGALLVAVHPPKTSGCTIRAILPTGEERNVRLDKVSDCLAATWVGRGPEVLVSVLPMQRSEILLVRVLPAQRSEILRVNTLTGERQKLPVNFDVFSDLSLDADGRRLLVSAGNPRPDMWMFKGLPWQR